MYWRILATEAVDATETRWWSDPDWRFLIPTGLSLVALLYSVWRNHKHEQRWVEQDARIRRLDDISDREVATQLRITLNHLPVPSWWDDDFVASERSGITVTNHHETLTFTQIDVVVQTDDVPAMAIEHVGILPPGDSKQVFIKNPEVHVRVVYKADYAGLWEITFADIDPEWRRVPEQLAP